MKVLEQDAVQTSKPVVAAAASAPAETKRIERKLGTFQCLVISVREKRRMMLEEAATEGGWEAIVCGDVENAWTAVKRQKFGLALVDLDGVESPEELKQLAEEVSKMKDTLLILCGNEGVALEEIWARQLGAWLYLPGVTAGSDVISLCEQARPVVEKLTGSSVPVKS